MLIYYTKVEINKRIYSMESQKNIAVQLIIYELINKIKA